MTAPLDTARVSRRRTLSGAAVAGIGVPLLAACGGGDGDSGTATDPAPSPSREAGRTPADTAEPSDAPAADRLTKTADVPEGGGRVLADEKLVVTQPAAGQFRCFTAVCTHQGCVVAGVEGGTINCNCHGSKFSIEDGSVANGPASSPLEEVPVDVQAGSVVRA